MNTDHLMEKAIQEITGAHRKIIEDWSKAYISQIYMEEGKIPNPGDFVLYEQLPTMKNAIFVKKYWFERKDEQ